MLIATEVPTKEEREEALALVPRREEILHLTGFARGTLANRSIDLIDAALGPGHGRAALVATYEGLDVLLQAAMDLVESAVCEQAFQRVDPMNPLGTGEHLEPELNRRRFPYRVARYRIEDAAVRVASAGDHLVNAHLRLAWETNAATTDEVRLCGFDPEQLAEPRMWSSVKDLRLGLRAVRRTQALGGVFSSFLLNRAFRAYATAPSVARTLRFRHEVVHRERPSYQEAPGFGRITRWKEGAIRIQYPVPQAEIDALPPLQERREMIAEAISITFDYAESIWDVLVRFCRSVDVWITREDDGVKVTTMHKGGAVLHPRESRDPGLFLTV